MSSREVSVAEKAEWEENDASRLKDTIWSDKAKLGCTLQTGHQLPYISLADLVIVRQTFSFNILLHATNKWMFHCSGWHVLKENRLFIFLSGLTFVVHTDVGDFPEFRTVRAILHLIDLIQKEQQWITLTCRIYGLFGFTTCLHSILDRNQKPTWFYWCCRKSLSFF